MMEDQPPKSMEEVMHPGADSDRDPAFPDAPAGWNQQQAQTSAQGEGLRLTDEHWEVVRALQQYYKRHDGQQIDKREVHDALEERFHQRGGLKYLYTLLPGGPIAQGCRLAGLQAPAGATDKGFGSVV